MLNIKIVTGRIQNPIIQDTNIGIEVNKEKNMFINPLLILLKNFNLSITSKGIKNLTEIINIKNNNDKKNDICP